MTANYFLPLLSHCWTARLAELGKFDFLLLTLLAELVSSTDFGFLEMSLCISTGPPTLESCLEESEGI